MTHDLTPGGAVVRWSRFALASNPHSIPFPSPFLRNGGEAGMTHGLTPGGAAVRWSRFALASNPHSIPFPSPFLRNGGEAGMTHGLTPGGAAVRWSRFALASNPHSTPFPSPFLRNGGARSREQTRLCNRSAHSHKVPAQSRAKPRYLEHQHFSPRAKPQRSFNPRPALWAGRCVVHLGLIEARPAVRPARIGRSCFSEAKASASLKQAVCASARENTPRDGRSAPLVSGLPPLPETRASQRFARGPSASVGHRARRTPRALPRQQ